MKVPPDGAIALPRTPSTDAAGAVGAGTALCPVVPVLLGVAVRRDFGPLLRLDATGSEALRAGNDRAAGLAPAAGIVLVLRVGCTRIWSGVRHLSDVIGGWSFGPARHLGTASLVGCFPGGRAALR